jgi:hypothetical protein
MVRAGHVGADAVAVLPVATAPDADDEERDAVAELGLDELPVSGDT